MAVANCPYAGLRGDRRVSCSVVRVHMTLGSVSRGHGHMSVYFMD